MKQQLFVWTSAQPIAFS